jgi:hypothetical protein
MTASSTVPTWQFDLWVEAEADGAATADELAALEADRDQWRSTLVRLLREAEAHLASARSLQGAERNQVLADAQFDVQRLTSAWNRFEGIDEAEVADEPQRQSGNGRAREEPIEPGEVRLQVSWEPGRVVAWGGGPGRHAADRDDVEQLLAASGAPMARTGTPPAAPWGEHTSIALPGGEAADALEAPVGEVLGWLVAAGAGQLDDVAPSVAWLGRVAIWAVSSRHGVRWSHCCASVAVAPARHAARTRRSPCDGRRRSWSRAACTRWHGRCRAVWRRSTRVSTPGR